MEEQQALLVAMQEKALNQRAIREILGALTKSEPVPTDFILIAAGNLIASRTCTLPQKQNKGIRLRGLCQHRHE